MGRYSANGSAGAQYDRSIYLQLWNVPPVLCRDIKNERIRIPRPRFSMTMGGHPYFFYKFIVSDRSSYDDGLGQRLLVAAPLPPNVKYAERVNGRAP